MITLFFQSNNSPPFDLVFSKNRGSFFENTRSNGGLLLLWAEKVYKTEKYSIKLEKIIYKTENIGSIKLKKSL